MSETEAPTGAAPPPPSPPAGPSDEETLREDEVAQDDAQAREALRLHKKALEEMPDGRRPFPPGTERPSWRRRTYIVDWKLQLNYASVYIATITLLLLGFVVLNFIFYFFAQRMLALHRVGKIEDAENIYYYIFANGIFIILLAIGMSLYAIVQSHRVAGPALRFRRALRQMLRRDYDFYLQLRRADYMQELADQVNVLNNALKAKDVVIADAALRIDEAADALAAKGQDVADLRDVGRELADIVLPLPEPPGDADPELGARVDGAPRA